MAGLPVWRALMRKGIAACVAAIETYNKPASTHREETFSILVVSAWESLLKARLVKAGGIRAIYVLEPGVTPTGRTSKHPRPQVNRSNNPFTISLSEAIKKCQLLQELPLHPLCGVNLTSMIEIRDNAVHFLSNDRELSLRVYEAGSAALKNFTSALSDWFDVSLGDHRFAILPLSFEPLSSATSLQPSKRTRQAANLIAFLDSSVDEAPVGDGRYAVSLRIDAHLVGGRNKEATAVRPTSDASAPVIRLSDDEVLKAFPMNYEALILRLNRRVSGFKQSKAFHVVLAKLKKDPRLAFNRQLDPTKKRATSMYLYADAMVDAVAIRMRENSLPLPLLDRQA